MAVGRHWSDRVHVVALALCLIFLPWSTAFLSMAQMLLVLNWLVGGVLTRTMAIRWRSAFATGPSLAFLSFFGLHLLGLFWTDDMRWGLDLVRILLPVLSFGAVLAGSSRLTARNFQLLLLLGAWSAVASSVFGAMFSRADAGDYRGLSLFISHIRLALMLCLAVAVFVWRGYRGPWWEQLARAAAIAWVLYFLARLGSVQGFALLALLGILLLWRLSGRLAPPYRMAIRLALVLVPVGLLVPITNALRAALRPPPADLPLTAPRSTGGESYVHDLSNAQQQNGTYVWTHIAWAELHRTWPLRSDRDLGGKDDRGHEMWATLLRYMASRGLAKDSVGVMALSDADVRAIERGVVDHREGHRSMLATRIDELLFELQNYWQTGTAGGHSLAMRLEYWRTGWHIARRHWLMGVGTGDTQRAFDAAYAAEGSSLPEAWRHRAHQQYLTLWISFGAFGLLFSLWTWAWPVWRTGAWRHPVFLSWAVILVVANLSDDTIETQAGATFFALHYALFVFAAPLVRSGEGPPTVPAHGPG
jgi:hypothetical protein